MLETRDHLFFQCNFSRRVYNYFQVDWSLGSNISDVAYAARTFGEPFFTEVVFVDAWNIWIPRNGLAFKRERESPFLLGDVNLYMIFPCLPIGLKASSRIANLP